MFSWKRKQKEFYFSGEFFVGEVDKLGWIAVTPEDSDGVHFCIHGNTQREATDNARAAIEFFYKCVEQSSEVSLSAGVPFKTTIAEKEFVPKEAIVANAC